MIQFLNHILDLISVFVRSDLWSRYLIPVLCLGILCLLVKVVYTICTISSKV